MLKLKFKSDWTQAGLKIHMACSSRANNFWVQQLVCSNKIISPLDLFRTYFKYLVSQFKVFLRECGSFWYQHDWPQLWVCAVAVLTFRNVFRCFVLFRRVVSWAVSSETVSLHGREAPLQLLPSPPHCLFQQTPHFTAPTYMRSEKTFGEDLLWINPSAISLLVTCHVEVVW